jgi:hypothetical protein
MRRWGAAMAMMALLSAAPVVAQGLGPYSSTQALERAAKAGDPEARWALAGAFAQSGQPAQAWRWIEGQEAQGSQRAYFKAWLGWKVGEHERALATIASCDQGNCRKLRANLLLDLGQPLAARDEMVSWFELAKDPEALTWLLSSCLVARDWAGFDRWERSAPWLIDEAFASARPSLTALKKLRLALGP